MRRMWKIIAPIFGYGCMGLALLFFGETGVYVLAAISLILLFYMRRIGDWLDGITERKIARQFESLQRRQHRGTLERDAVEAEALGESDASRQPERHSSRQ